MTQMLIIGAGGFIGANLRYFISAWVMRSIGSSFPYGTLAVNGLGSFILGLVMAYSSQVAPMSHETRLFLGTGMMGALTTFSTFSYETLQLLQGGNYISAISNIAGNVFISLVAVCLGILVTKTAT